MYGSKYALMMRAAAAALLVALIVPVPASGTRAVTLFFEDFSSPTLDRSKWNVIVTGRTVNDEQQAYVDSPETIAILRDAPDAGHGALSITARHKPGFKTPEG